MRSEVTKILEWFNNEFGRCDGYSFDCLQCRSMRLRDKIESYFEFIDILDNEDINGKEIRPHKE